jgi:ABC-type multidrug transport system permease subunit
LGGLFWPLYSLPRTVQTIAQGLMTTWSMSAIQNVMLRGRTITGVSTEVLVLVSYALISFLIALRLFRYNGEARA